MLSPSPRVAISRDSNIVLVSDIRCSKPTDGFFVSQQSRWEDPVWRFKNPIYSSETWHSRIAWDFSLPDGTRLTDPQWSTLLDAFKRFTWSLFSDPRGKYGASLKPGGVSHVYIGIRYLARWMNRRNYISFNELNDSASDLFLDDFADSSAMPRIEAKPKKNTKKRVKLFGSSAANAIADVGMSAAWVYQHVIIWQQLWRQTGALRKAGVPTLPEAPFSGKGANAVARELAVRVAGKIPPLPDEVALPMMSAAFRMIGTPADDVIRLHSLYIKGVRDIEQRGLLSNSARHCALLKVVNEFRFSIISGENKPWRGALSECDVDDFDLTYRGCNQETYLQGTNLLRSLINTIVAACAIVIQFGAGIRTSELCGPEPGINPVTGLPLCVRVCPSGSRVIQLFYLTGRLFKGEATWREEEWILGCRPVGSSEIPPPVRALEVLVLLLDPWRKLASNPDVAKSLFVAPAKHGMPDPNGHRNFIALTDTRIRTWQKRFVYRFVDLSHLPDRSRRGEDLVPYRESNGACFFPQQFRKTFVKYVCGTDSRMLPAVNRHYKHMSMAMTEGYLGRNPMLQDAFESNLNESSSRYIYEFARGKQAPAGRMAKLIEEHRAELQKLTEGKDEGDGRKEVHRWVCHNGLRIFFSEHGKCFFAADPLGARCHQEAGTVHWLNSEPNYSTRRPSLCLGCPCFLVDEEHVDFWLQRYIENRKAFDQGAAIGKAGDYRVAHERAQQSAAVLVALNIPIPEV